MDAMTAIDPRGASPLRASGLGPEAILACDESNDWVIAVPLGEEDGSTTLCEPGVRFYRHERAGGKLFYRALWMKDWAEWHPGEVWRVVSDPAEADFIRADRDATDALRELGRYGENGPCFGLRPESKASEEIRQQIAKLVASLAVVEREPATPANGSKNTRQEAWA